MKVEINITGFKGYILVGDNSFDLIQITVNNFIDKSGAKGKNYGQEVENNLGFFKSFGGALDKALQVGFSNRDEKLTIRSFINEYKSIKQSILSIL